MILLGLYRYYSIGDRYKLTKTTVKDDEFSTQPVDIGHKIAGLYRSNTTKRPSVDEVTDDSLTAEYSFYVELSSAKDVKDFKRKIGTAVKRLGFSEYAFIRLNGLVDAELLISVDPTLVTTYFNHGLHEADLVLQHACEDNIQPFFRSVVNEHVFQIPCSCPLTRCMRAADKLNRTYGYYDYYNIPAKAKNGLGQVLFSVTERGAAPSVLKRKVKEHYVDLQLLGDAIDFVSTRKFPGELLGDEQLQPHAIKINPRPLEVLEMLANHDLNATQVAERLDITVVTANRHLQAARKAFGVRTTYAALKQAFLNKLIVYK